MEQNIFKVYNLSGEEVSTVEQPELFATPIDHNLIHRYYTWVRTMIRSTLAHTKTRGEVSGGGKKPWRQKGTGRARVGSSRSPIWRTGGIVFGPQKTQTWATRMPRVERRKALFSALSSKAATENVTILESWSLDAPKTKAAQELLQNLKLNDKKVLHVTGEFTPNLFKSTKNLVGIDSVTVQKMNIIDILNHDTVLMTVSDLKAFEQHFTDTHE